MRRVRLGNLRLLPPLPRRRPGEDRRRAGCLPHEQAPVAGPGGGECTGACGQINLRTL